MFCFYYKKKHVSKITHNLITLPMSNFTNGFIKVIFKKVSCAKLEPYTRWLLLNSIYNESLKYQKSCYVHWRVYIRNKERNDGNLCGNIEQIGKKFQIRISSIKLDTVRIEETTGDRCRNLSNTFLHLWWHKFRVS